MRKKIVAGNWKMNMDFQEGIALFNQVNELVNAEITGTQKAIVCSPYIHLTDLVQLAKVTGKVGIGAQNVHQAESGAYTGEISAKMLWSIGVQYVIIGHSERRQYFGETDELLAQKTDAALKHDRTPIFCIGETLQQRQHEDYLMLIKEQLYKGLFHLDAEAISKVVIAYEPVWAIGTGVTASAEQAQEVHQFIRQVLAAKYDQAIADGITILYGGSCNPKNAAELFAKPDIDGGLIGGASLKARDFVDILKVFN